MFWVLCRVHWNRGKVHHRANVMVIVLPNLKWWSRQPQLKCEHNSCRQLFADLGSMPLYEARQQQFKRSNTWWKLQLNTTDYCNKPGRYHLWHFVRRKLCDTIYCYVKGISASTPSVISLLLFRKYPVHFWRQRRFELNFPDSQAADMVPIAEKRIFYCVIFLAHNWFISCSGK